MTSTSEVAQRFYRALGDSDGRALFDLLTDDFEGTVSAGMPLGVGGEHHGRVAMITDVWGRIAAAYDVEVAPCEYLTVGGADKTATVDGDSERVVVLGSYRGAARDGDAAVNASFAHVITVRNGRITALQQITDTLRWQIPT